MPPIEAHLLNMVIWRSYARGDVLRLTLCYRDGGEIVPKRPEIEGWPGKRKEDIAEVAPACTFRTHKQTTMLRLILLLSII